MKRIFITGSSSGLGAGLARHYAEPGATIGLCARRAELLTELAEQLRARGAKPIVLPADVASREAMQRAHDAFIAEAGGAELVIANAGVGIPSALLEGDARSVEQLMQINVIGVTNTIIPFLPGMVAAGRGTVVAVSSMAGHRALPGRAAYSASKAAVITFMDGLRMDLQGSGVHAMTLCPGFVRTPMTDVLTHPMPFLVELDDAVAIMARSIERRDRTFSFPWQMAALKQVMTRAPEWLLRRLAPAGRKVGTI